METEREFFQAALGEMASVLHKESNHLQPMRDSVHFRPGDETCSSPFHVGSASDTTQPRDPAWRRAAVVARPCFAMDRGADPLGLDTDRFHNALHRAKATVSVEDQILWHLVTRKRPSKLQLHSFHRWVRAHSGAGSSGNPALLASRSNAKAFFDWENQL
jgi:hypothetical protein